VKEDGMVVEEEREIKNLISNFYRNLFSATTGARVEELLSQIAHKVSDDMNTSLLRPFSAEEVKGGLDAIGDFKAPGSDGMTSLF
jgi:hypothetical protein